MRLREACILLLPAELLARLADLVAARLGLAFRGDRLDLLARGIAEAAPESGFADPADYARWLLEATVPPAQLALLAGHLTIGETYFFREPATLDLLRQEILPGLLAQRCGGGDRPKLRAWSAGCATGEEAYSIAMLLDGAITDREVWDVGLLATDVNPHFLAQARRGIYRDWSFRAMPEETQRCFFRPASQGGFEIAARLRRQVSFEPLNLAEPAYPAPHSGTTGLDVVLCRNVLIYFEPAQALKAAARLADCLVPGGWLLIGAAEAGLACFTENEALEPLLPTVFRKRAAPAARPLPRRRVRCAVAAAPTRDAALRVDAAALCREVRQAWRQGRHEEAAGLAEHCGEAAPFDLAPSLLAARIHADRGALVQALEAADRALMRDRMSAEIHHLRASILAEMGREAEAARSFNSALYLSPDFVAAHYGLGLLALREGRGAGAHRHFDTALRILAGRPAEEEVAGLDGLLVRDLAELVRAMREASLAETTP